MWWLFLEQRFGREGLVTTAKWAQMQGKTESKKLERRELKIRVRGALLPPPPLSATIYGQRRALHVEMAVGVRRVAIGGGQSGQSKVLVGPRRGLLEGGFRPLNSQRSKVPFPCTVARIDAKIVPKIFFQDFVIFIYFNICEKLYFYIPKKILACKQWSWNVVLNLYLAP